MTAKELADLLDKLVPSTIRSGYDWDPMHRCVRFAIYTEDQSQAMQQVFYPETMTPRFARKFVKKMVHAAKRKGWEAVKV
jgi:hypothetical protein